VQLPCSVLLLSHWEETHRASVSASYKKQLHGGLVEVTANEVVHLQLSVGCTKATHLDAADQFFSTTHHIKSSVIPGKPSQAGPGWAQPNAVYCWDKPTLG
jgi:hypothetical protein